MSELEQSDPAPLPGSKTRKIKFFRLVAQHRDYIMKSPQVDWAFKLAKACEQTPPAREYSDDHKQSYVFDHRGTSTVAVAKRVIGSPVQLVGQDQTIRPLLLEDLDAYLAFTTYAYLYTFNAFGILSGAPGTPRSAAVASLANHLHPLGDGGRWQARPLMEPAQLEQFEETGKGGVRSLVVKADVTPSHLLSQDGQVRSLFDYMTALSDAVGSELSVEMTVRVKHAKQHPSSLRRLFGLIKPGEIRPSASKLQVTSADQEMLDLMEHNLAREFDLPVLEGGIDLDSLVESIETVGGNMQTRIQEAVIAAEA